MKRSLAKHPGLHTFRNFLAYCYLARGERERAFDLIDDHVIETCRADQDGAYWLASVYALAEMPDDAIRWLEQAISIGNENYPWFSTDPNWDAMREEPRYKAILENLKTKWEQLVEAANRQQASSEQD